MATSNELASPLTDLPDHLLAEIFFRLHDPADLVRASAACASFHRLATDASFLCRFRRLHAPPFLGFVAAGRFRPAAPPHPSAPAARVLALAADFHFYFILSRCRWTVQDVRDGRILLEDLDSDLDERPPVFKDLAVCDPLHRRKMEFSIADLPPGKWSKVGIAIVEAGDGRLGMFGFHGETSSDLSYAIAQNKGESPSQWQMEKTISLDSGYRYFITDATQRYLLLRRIQASSLENPLVGYFSMDFKTLQLQRVYDKPDCLQYETYTYINFPPSLLSSRRI